MPSVRLYQPWWIFWYRHWGYRDCTVPFAHGDMYDWALAIPGV